MSSLQSFLNSQTGQFVLGGTTVSGISYISNYMSPLLGGIFGGIPIGLPSSVFIDDKKVLDYLQNLSAMTIILSIVTITAYLLKRYKNYNKYDVVKTSMGMWVLFAFIYYLLRLYNYF